MKKTLVALAVTAFAATSANAFTAYEADGTTVQVNGSLRLAVANNSTKAKNQKRDDKHSSLYNNGSRFGFNVKHNIADDFYALGRLEFRLDGNTATDSYNASDKFHDLYTKRAYVGLGSKQYGELTFGRQLTIGDDIGTASFDYIYGIGAGLLTDEGGAVVRYDYKGIEGLQVGVNYNFGDEREDVTGNKNEIIAGTPKNGYGVGATYSFDIAEGQSAELEAGYTRDNYATTNGKRGYKDAWEVAASYTIDALTVGVEGSQAYTKNKASDNKRVRNSVIAVGAKYRVTPVTSVYAGYGYHQEKVSGAAKGTPTHKYLLGADYKLHKNVVTFIEGGISEKGRGNSKSRDTGVAAGLRVFW